MSPNSYQLPPKAQRPKKLENDMKKFLLGTVALVALGFGPAVAADMRARPAPAPAPVYAPIYNWSGFYLGGHIGFGFNGGDDLVGFTGDDNGGFLAGGQIGFDWQLSPNWVVGLEGQLSWVDFDQAWAGTFGVNTFALARSGDWLGSITGRIGYTWGPGLLYVKGGWAFADNDYTLVVDGAPAVFTSGDNSNSGWTLGAGLEYMFAPSWSAKLEYQYYNFGGATLVAPLSGSVRRRRRRRQRHPHCQARRELPLQLGCPGRRAVLIN